MKKYFHNKKGFSAVELLVLVIVVGIIGAGAMVYMRSLDQNDPDVSPAPTTTLGQPTATPTPNPTSDWETYKNPIHNYSLRYPTNYRLLNEFESSVVNVQSYEDAEIAGFPSIPDGYSRVEIIYSYDLNDTDTLDSYISARTTEDGPNGKGTFTKTTIGKYEYPAYQWDQNDDGIATVYFVSNGKGILLVNTYNQNPVSKQIVATLTLDLRSD